MICLSHPINLIKMDIELLLKEINYKAVRSSGSGGQNVNKVATKVQLSWDLESTLCFDDEAKETSALLVPRDDDGTPPPFEEEPAAINDRRSNNDHEPIEDAPSPPILPPLPPSKSYVKLLLLSSFLVEPPEPSVD